MRCSAVRCSDVVLGVADKERGEERERRRGEREKSSVAAQRMLYSDIPSRII